MRYGIFFAAIFAALAVLIGAFAAHGLKSILSAESLAVMQTGVLYQFIHSLALLLVAVLAQSMPSRALLYASWFFIAGMVLFSGSLYVLVLTPFTPGLITPIGGSLLVLGWLSLACSAKRAQ